MKFNTKTIHGGQKHEEATGAVMPPIFQTSTYAQSSPGVHKGYAYSRGANPTRTALEDSLAALENGTHGFAFSSGLAAIDCVLRTLNPGDEVIAGDDLYGGTYRMFTRLFMKYGLEFSYVDMNLASNVKDVITEKTKLVWIESPTNPTLKVSDIQEISKIAKSVNALLVVDNTFASPIAQQPLSLGADIIIHSGTKYIGGHSDLVAGLVVTKTQGLSEKIKFIQNASGGVLGPWDCFLTIRGIETLELRYKKQCEIAFAVAAFLNNHEAVQDVYFPGLVTHKNHDIAKRQQNGLFGGIVSFTLKEDTQEAANQFVTSTNYFKLAESLGGVKSLLCHPPQMTHASIPREIRLQSGIKDSLIRLSCGIEDADDLINDLKQAFKAVNSLENKQYVK